MEKRLFYNFIIFSKFFFLIKQKLTEKVSVVSLWVVLHTVLYLNLYRYPYILYEEISHKNDLIFDFFNGNNIIIHNVIRLVSEKTITHEMIIRLEII